MYRFFSPLLMAFVLASAATPAYAARSEEGTIRSATAVLNEFFDLSVKDIPASLLEDAHAVAIIPDVIKLGLVVGGQRGKGVVVMREKDGGWRAPVFVTITGGSIGWQAGAQATDIVLVFKTEKSVQGLMKGKFTLGADAAVAAGPVGRRVEAATDSQLRAEIYSYSRSRGLFAGVSLDGSALQIDDEANAAYYGLTAPGESPRPAPESALKLVQMVANAIENPEAAVHGEPPARSPDLSPVPPDATSPGRPVVNLQPPSQEDALREDLARSMTQLSALLDERWRAYLALPAEVFQKGSHPRVEDLEASLGQFDSVAAGPAYRGLTGRPEFQKAYDLLRAYRDALAAGSRPLTLPPPPNSLPATTVPARSVPARSFPASSFPSRSGGFLPRR